ncbi:c-type cytochrome [Rufibacter sp. LB8]|uniref:c-type cytochrome n=1 Tax=Rufibacter sp. LB8 TaxID=2777781 RepID=UPI00178C3739|nr:c-type cytochrome [Rufibacter sp. LB8]
MKKVIFLFSVAATLAACTSNSSTETTQTTTAETETPGTGVSTSTDSTRAAGPAANEAIANGAKLIAQSDCIACHSVNEKLIGPSYEAVAQKYDATEENTAYLAGKIINGGSGVWGDVAMTPHPTISEQDARQMAQYVMSLKK